MISNNKEKLPKPELKQMGESLGAKVPKRIVRNLQRRNVRT